MTAATPATCGVAIDVPDFSPYAVFDAVRRRERVDARRRDLDVRRWRSRTTRARRGGRSRRPRRPRRSRPGSSTVEFAVVAGRGDEDRAVAACPRVLHGALQRRRRAAAERHRDDPRALVLQPADAVRDVGRVAAGRAARRAPADRQRRVERDARDAAAVVRVARDRARDVRAVRVVVGARALLDRARRGSSVPARLRAVGDLAGEVLVRREDAGVDDADLRPAGRRERAEPGRVPALGRVDVGVGQCRRTGRCC